MADSQERPEKEKTPSSRFEDDLVNYRPGIAITDPRSMTFYDLDNTPSLDRLVKATEPYGTTDICDRYENYVSKSFASAYDKFDTDPTLRRLRTDAKLQNDPAYKSRYSKTALDDDLDLSADSLKALYTEYNNERSGRNEFDVYQPKALIRAHDSRNMVSIRDVDRSERETSPANMEKTVESYKSGFSKWSDPQDHKPDLAHRYRLPRERQVLIDTSKYGLRGKYGAEDTPTSLPRNEYLRKGDSMYVGSNFVMLTLRSPDRWYDKVDKLLQEAKDI